MEGEQQNNDQQQTTSRRKRTTRVVYSKTRNSPSAGSSSNNLPPFMAAFPSISGTSSGDVYVRGSSLDIGTPNPNVSAPPEGGGSTGTDQIDFRGGCTPKNRSMGQSVGLAKLGGSENKDHSSSIQIETKPETEAFSGRSQAAAGAPTVSSGKTSSSSSSAQLQQKQTNRTRRKYNNKKSNSESSEGFPSSDANENKHHHHNRQHHPHNPSAPQYHSTSASSNISTGSRQPRRDPPPLATAANNSNRNLPPPKPQEVNFDYKKEQFEALPPLSSVGQEQMNSRAAGHHSQNNPHSKGRQNQGEGYQDRGQRRTSNPSSGGATGGVQERFDNRNSNRGQEQQQNKWREQPGNQGRSGNNYHRQGPRGGYESNDSDGPPVMSMIPGRQHRPPLNHFQKQHNNNQPQNYQHPQTHHARRGRGHQGSESSGGGGHHHNNRQQYQNRAPPSYFHNQAQSQSYDNQYKKQKHNTNVQTQQQQQLPPVNVYSPIFTDQVPSEILELLRTPPPPLQPGTEYRHEFLNPYKAATREKPLYRKLFQELVRDNNLTKNKQAVASSMQFKQMDLSTQLEQFYKAQSLTQDEARLRWQFISDLFLFLRQSHPKCELYAFGSMLTRLADETSDIDIYVDLNQESSAAGGGSTSTQQVSSAKQRQDTLETVRKILYKAKCPYSGNLFIKRLIPVRGARVPILKLQHSAPIYCDISFENRLSVQNTKMLRLFMDLNPKIHQFMMLVRYWAKFHNLTGSFLIKNYALALLVLVYLCQKSLVPHVYLLQKLAASERKKNNVTENPNEIAGWDASFCDNKNLILQSYQRKPFPRCGGDEKDKPTDAQILISMVLEFFEMYSNVNFEEVVVCPLIGMMIPKEDFALGKEENLPKPLKRYANKAKADPKNVQLRTDTPLSIQDPFLLSYNVGSVTPIGTVYKFQIACAKAHQVLQKRGELNSLLDVFIPLPLHIGEQKFMQVYKTEIKTKELTREIKTGVISAEQDKENRAVEEAEAVFNYVNKEAALLQPEKEEEASSSSSSKDSKAKPSKLSIDYVNVPAHLGHVAHLIDPASMKLAEERKKWDSFIDFKLNKQFEQVFLTELDGYKLLLQLQKKKIDTGLTMAWLWRQFVLDFSKEVFVRGLKLKILNDEENTSPSAGKGKKSKWSLSSAVSNPNASPKEEKDMDILLKKIQNLTTTKGANTKHNHYRVIKVEVSYPFWEKRSAYYSQVVPAIPKNDVINIPILTKEKKKQKGSKSKRRSGHGVGASSGAPFTNEDLIKTTIIKSFDSVGMEERISMIILAKHQDELEKKEKDMKPFKSFTINVLVKLEFFAGQSRPKVYFLLEKDQTEKNDERNVERTFQTASKILRQALPEYVTFQLAKWANLTSVQASNSGGGSSSVVDGGQANTIKSTTTASSTTETSKEVSNADIKKAEEGNDVNVKEDRGKQNGKSAGRSKIEEDLLIPPSSSSTDNDEDSLSEYDDEEVYECEGGEEIAKSDQDQDDVTSTSDEATGESSDQKVESAVESPPAEIADNLEEAVTEIATSEVTEQQEQKKEVDENETETQAILQLVEKTEVNLGTTEETKTVEKLSQIALAAVIKTEQGQEKENGENGQSSQEIEESSSGSEKAPAKEEEAQAVLMEMELASEGVVQVEEGEGGVKVEVNAKEENSENPKENADNQEESKKNVIEIQADNNADNVGEELKKGLSLSEKEQEEEGEFHSYRFWNRY